MSGVFRNIDPPPPHRPASVPPPHPLVPGRGAHLLVREGVGESQFRRGEYVLCGLILLQGPHAFLKNTLLQWGKTGFCFGS
jgi:hypothetical protein